ncbi:MAG: hypothetical protein LBS62_02500 [Clostridiales bacterium]|jgi:hypothetical protein|nr:hypothetical protein [Clostridiales bacterium]
MALSQEFQDAVKQGKIRLVKTMLRDSIVSDPTFAAFDEMMQAAKGLPGLIEVHDGEKFHFDTAYWTNEYMAEQITRILSNFSQERLDLLKGMSKQLNETVSQERPEEGGRADKPEARRARKRLINVKDLDFSSRPRQADIGIGVAIAGIGMSVVGFALSKDLLIKLGLLTMTVGDLLVVTGMPRAERDTAGL